MKRQLQRRPAGCAALEDAPAPGESAGDCRCPACGRGLGPRLTGDSHGADTGDLCARCWGFWVTGGLALAPALEAREVKRLKRFAARLMGLG